MSRTNINKVGELLSTLEGAQDILIKAVNTDGMEGKRLIESAIYIIEHAVPAVRKQLYQPVVKLRVNTLDSCQESQVIFPIHEDCLKQVLSHSDEDIGKFFRAMYTDIIGGESPELPDTLKMLKNIIDN